MAFDCLFVAPGNKFKIPQPACGEYKFTTNGSTWTNFIVDRDGVLRLLKTGGDIGKQLRIYSHPITVALRAGTYCADICIRAEDHLEFVLSFKNNVLCRVVDSRRGVIYETVVKPPSWWKRFKAKLGIHPRPDYVTTLEEILQ